MVNNNPLVCFFDSGIGGLSLLYECVRKLPNVDFTYFADNYHMPYGILEHNKMLGMVDEIFSEINKLNPAAAVVACNTVTAECIDFLRKKYSFNIVGIQPAVKPAVAAGGKCLVLATSATAKSKSLKSLCEKYGNGKTQVAETELAEYIERNIGNLKYDDVKKLLPTVKADSVVLGCTHYVFISEFIKKFYNCPVFDGISGTADNLSKKLGISDHQTPRAQKISFCGGDEAKNRDIFHFLLKQSGIHSQNF